LVRVVYGDPSPARDVGLSGGNALARFNVRQRLCTLTLASHHATAQKMTFTAAIHTLKLTAEAIAMPADVVNRRASMSIIRPLSPNGAPCAALT
jgi:ribonuclease HI